MKQRPSEENAQEAERILTEAILKFSDEARHPKERGTPNPDPHWKPRPSTLRFSWIRGGGYAWSMDADDPQVVAYYVEAAYKEPFTRVTSNGHSRHIFQTHDLKGRQIYPTEYPWREWYDHNQRYRMQEVEPRRRY